MTDIDTGTTPKNGMEFETVFSSNSMEDSPFRFRSTRMNGLRAPKVILCNDSQIQVGQPCIVRITSIKKPASSNRGFIEVEFLRSISFRLDDSVYVNPTIELLLQALLENGKNILLDGPQGSGKTLLSYKIAEALDFEYVFFNSSSVFESTDFLATLQIKATSSGQAETVWIKTDILRALEDALENPEKKYLIFLDEFNRCREMARNGIMPALDSTRKMYNPLTGSNINIPDNVIWIAAINNGAQFTGTANVDPAQLDRFAILKLGYPPEGKEIDILQQRYPRLPKGQIKIIVKLANTIRHDKTLRLDLSMRATDEICMLMNHPNFASSDPSNPSTGKLVKICYCGRFKGNWYDSSTEAGMVWQKLSSDVWLGIGPF